MSKGYWIVNIDVEDADGYAKYVDLVRPFLGRCNAKFLAVGGEFEVMEGQLRSRIVVIEFASYEYALTCYNSEEYQAMIGLRTAASTANFAIVKGV